MMPGLLRRLIQSRRGAVALEFAFVAPLFVILMLGGIEIVSVIRAHTKAQKATEAFAQMVASQQTITFNNFYDYCQIATYFMESFTQDDAVNGVIEVYRYDIWNGAIVDGNILGTCGGYTIYGPDKRAAAMSMVPNIAGTGAKDGQVILFRASFDYRSPFMTFLPSVLKIETTAFARPRYGYVSSDNALSSMIEWE